MHFFSTAIFFCFLSLVWLLTSSNFWKLLLKHQEVCLKINGKQTVKLRSGSNKFKNNFKQLAVPFKFYADFECYVKGVKDSK